VQSRDVVGFALIPLALLATGWLAKTLPIWSVTGGHTIPWFCNALAIALLVAGGTSLLCGQALAAIPVRAAVLAAAGAILIVGIGFVVDALTHGRASDWTATLGEWVGFTVLVIGSFWLPRAAATRDT